MHRLTISPTPRESWDAIAAASPELRDACEYFSGVLGDAPVRGGHPIVGLFGAGLLGALSEGERLFSYVRALDGVVGRDNLVRDLGGRSLADFRSGEMTLRLAAAWRGLGREVEIVGRTSERTPDLKIDLGERSMFVECVSLNEADAEEELNALLEAISQWSCAANGRLTVEFHPDSTPEDARWVLDQLADLGDAQAPVRRKGERAWVHFEPGARNNLTPFAAGIRYERADELKRLLGRIGKKQRQLPAGELNLLVIDVGDLFGWNDVDEVRAAISNRAASFPRVGAVLVRQDNVCASSPRTFRGLAFRGTGDDGMLRHGVLVLNPSARVPFEPSEVEAILAVTFK